ncbi:DUF7544 domain-containing protein [Tunturiibacter lichenicola]|uniref:DUF7544 domain-containing protein n=1 Tax=Tunturiibacter lichenicola TaxID=2051959 RepID=UPI0021B3A15E|nr:hypothetical protein [Edaphobacter lichenicola]
MRTLSAAESVTPAIEHAKAMFLPFSLPRVLKLGLVALLAELSAQFFFPPGSTRSHSNGQPSFSVTPHLAIILAVIGILFFLVGLCFVYFGSRMQFVLMDLVAYRTTFVRPSWRRHASQTWPWIGLKIGSFLLILAAIGIIAVWPILHFVRSIPAGTNPAQSAGFFGHFLLLFIMIAGAVLVMMLCLWFLRDFVLPFLVFEGTTIRTALSRAFDLVRNEPADALLYFLLKLVLTIGTAIAAELCIIAAALVAAIPLGLVGGALWLLLRNAGEIGTLLLSIGLGLLCVIFAACILLAVICIVGAVLVFYQAYTLYFLGGRIPALGNLLEPPPPPIMEATPMQPSPA